MMSRRFRSLAVAMMAVLATAGCSSQDPDPAPETSPTPTLTATPTPTSTPTPAATLMFTPTPSQVKQPATKATTKPSTKPQSSGWDKNSNGVCDPSEVLDPAPEDGKWSTASEHGCQYDPDLQDIWDKENAAEANEAERLAEVQKYKDAGEPVPNYLDKEGGDSEWAKDQAEWAEQNGY